LQDYWFILTLKRRGLTPLCAIKNSKLIIMYKPRVVSCVLLTIFTKTAPHIAEVEQLCNT
ncbi:hypothetical protein, partial [Leyella stercorea]|uniref:hypothetical protein n=1 Tax=Leyella stercorea TaxID=363265 RepID=UPI00266BD4DE